MAYLISTPIFRVISFLMWLNLYSLSESLPWDLVRLVHFIQMYFHNKSLKPKNKLPTHRSVFKSGKRTVSSCVKVWYYANISIHSDYADFCHSTIMSLDSLLCSPHNYSHITKHIVSFAVISYNNRCYHSSWEYKLIQTYSCYWQKDIHSYLYFNLSCWLVSSHTVSQSPLHA